MVFGALVAAGFWSASVMAQFVLVCTEAPVGGSCPAGAEAWIDAQLISGVPELSSADLDLLLGAVLLLVAIAVGIRFLIRQFGK